MNTLKPTSRSRRSPAILAFSLLVSGLLLQACATSGGGGPPPASGPVELDKTKWKLLSLGGQLDGRVVEFKRRGEDGYSGTLIDLGKRLRDAVGVQEGVEVFQLKRKKENEYEGIYNAIDPSGNKMAKEVVVSIDGNSLNWNQESAVWERVE